MNRSTEALRIGFACHWVPNMQRAWSGTPWALRSALSERCDLQDIGVELPLAVQAGLKYSHLRRSTSGVKSIWQYSPATDRIVEKKLRQAASSQHLDAVLQIQDLSKFDQPYLIYQDLSFGTLLRLRTQGTELIQFPALSERTLQSRAQRQWDIYLGASGIITMSQWLKSQLLLDGILPEQIHVVYPGSNATHAAPNLSQNRPAAAHVKDAPYQGQRPPHLLFVGRDFQRKAGDLVVEAFTILRRTRFPLATLTVVGPRQWPLRTAPPDGVVYQGELSGPEVRRLMGATNLFVMPSRFEAFGIVFAEALSAGAPCIARSQFAMPEIVQHGRNGLLVDSDSTLELVQAMEDALNDYAMHERVWMDRAATSKYWSWSRAADELVRIVDHILSGPPRMR